MAILLLSRSVMSNSLQPHGQQHASLPSSSPSPGACSNSCRLNWWYHPTILSSAVPFASCLQSFPASGSFPMSRLFPSGGQNTRASTSSSVFPMTIQDWFPLGLTGLTESPRDSQESSPTPHFKSINSSAPSFPYGPALTSMYDYWKIHGFDYMELVGKVMSLLLIRCLGLL